NLVTKSGSNEWHGDLFEFVRNFDFNARNAFSPTRDTIKRNQFGGTVGGAIIKNKLFFFAGIQSTILRQTPVPTRSFLPTAAMLSGDFTQVTSPACNAGRQINLAAPFVNNRIDPTLFSKVSTGIVNQPDFPKTSDPCGLFLWGNPIQQSDH